MAGSISPSPIVLVRWQALCLGQQEAVLRLQLPAEQVEFAGTIERAIAPCEAADQDEVAGLRILHSAHPVGFVVVSRGSKLPAWAPAGSAAITAMRVDPREQGKGIGKATLGLLDTWIGQQWSTTSVLALCVDEANHAGRRAYAAAGFKEYAEPKPGRIGVVRYLSKHLGTARSDA
jgi:GNAT superfamily N-acetyltransferase